jgi:hypothetical protein
MLISSPFSPTNWKLPPVGQPEEAPGPSRGVSSGLSRGRSVPAEDVRLSIAGRLGRGASLASDIGGWRVGFESSSSPIETPESRGLNLCPTVTCSATYTSSCNGFKSSNIGGSAGENAEIGGVRLFVDKDERDEFELPKSGSLRLFGERFNARPDLRPWDREMDAPAIRQFWSPLLIRLCAR